MVLVTVGRAYQSLLKRRDVSFRKLRRADIDCTKRETLRSAILRDTAFLINAGGYAGKPNVDACGLQKRNWVFGNAMLPGVIADVSFSRPKTLQRGEFEDYRFEPRLPRR